MLLYPNAWRWRKATAEKLTASFGYLTEHAPHILKRDGVHESIPQPDTVHALSRVRESDTVPAPMFNSIQADAFSMDVSPSSLARKFKEAIAEPPSKEQAEGQRTDRAVSLARKLADLLADMHRSLPNTLAADDVVIVISASGDSENILKAVRLARERGAVTVGILGFGGGQAGSLVDHQLTISNQDFFVSAMAKEALSKLS